MMDCPLPCKEKYKDTFELGIYVCAKCGNELFDSKTKFTHNSPWPAFTDTIKDDSVVETGPATEPQLPCNAAAQKVSCGNCKAELGYK